LEELGGTPREILAQRELMELFMPILRSDFSLSETFKYQGEHQLGCDATLLYGAQDEDVPEEDVLQWQDLIANKVETRKFSGDHFFINSQKDEVLEYLNQRLTGLLQGLRLQMMA
jgi:medium-chain acyl-[acyl-carrier-protein] hydrolase